jgi:hypothetical protein
MVAFADRIPPRMHFFFSGPRLSWMRWMSLFSFRKLNPTWEMTLWMTSGHADESSWVTDEVQDFANTGAGGGIAGAGAVNHWDRLKPLKIEVKPYLPPAPFTTATPVHQSDLCRWAVLGEYGGWYADTDILWVDSMESAVGWSKSADVALVAYRDHAPIGFFGAKPGQKFFRELYLAAKANYSASNYQSAGADALGRVIWGPGGMSSRDGFGMRHNSSWPSMSDLIRRAFPHTSFCFMPIKSVYPWDSLQVHKIFSQDCEVPNRDVIGIHWYGGHKLAQKWNGKLSEFNFRHYQNTFCHFARNLLDDNIE